jgi:endonuclease-8
MNGRWRVRERGGPPWRGAPWLVLRTSEWEATQWNGPVLSLGDAPARTLGPDLLAPETDTHDVVARLRRADQGLLVGEALVDQRLVAGIGNMWLSELLWHARVSPWGRLGDVPNESLTAALDWSREAMSASVAGRRSARAVYRRAGRGCPRCGDVVQARGLGDANRTAYWCPTCQPLP